MFRVLIRLHYYRDNQINNNMKTLAITALHKQYLWEGIDD